MLAANARALPIRRKQQQRQQQHQQQQQQRPMNGRDSKPPSLLARLGSLRERLAPASAATGAVKTTTTEATAAAAAAAAPSASQPQKQQQQQPQPPTHLIVLVNGLFGSPGNWEVASAALAAELSPPPPPPPPPSSSSTSSPPPPPPPPLIVASAANSRAATYDGIDVCGQRLADEVRAVAARHPSLQRVSFVAHSMGGLMARYAAGALFDPRSGQIAGLQPCHFLTLATPHMGCDAEGVAQVPFVGWASKVLPASGAAVLRGISAPVAAALFRRTGKQFFLEDGGLGGAGGGGGGGNGGGDHDDGGDLPLLARLARDDPSRGLYFLSALASFRTRTCYANVSGDHLVGWANASIRPIKELPELPSPSSASASTPSSSSSWCRYVVREDPAAAAFAAGDPAAARAQGQSGGGGGSGGAWHAEASSAVAAAAAPTTGAEEEEEEGVLPPSNEAEAEARAAEEDLSAGLRAASPPLAAALAAAEHPPAGIGGGGDPRPLVGISHPERASMVADMLLRLCALPWRRVDVCFSTGGGAASSGGSGERPPLRFSSAGGGGGGGGLLAAPTLPRVLGLAHNNIQVTRRLLNSEGEAVVAHVARTLREMDEAVLGVERAAGAGAGEGDEAAAAAAAAAAATLR